ncbi:heme transporter [Devosia limi DSM 17137]|uniref:Heme exporter protein B n=1 Tax=Devosia limi DSM 17137 TaxID=1121477 RepID=A0A0F5LV64_9HYPH|nr:heme exporter protein CcmB [Devosia limi]KKB86262.1 heme transporter [Devosia limi DSM 17137]KKB86265.1 heme transporter [Devosia limi DSM 17137]SHF15623.1 heme exporter protein B [Devosia limi DSM 17137]
MTGFLAVIGRELHLALRGGGDVLTLVLFFVIIGVVVPFAVGPDQALLARLAPGVVWIAAFLAMLLGLDRLFRADNEDGTLILLRQADLPFAAIVAAKVMAHWLVSALPLIVASPMLAVLLAMDLEAFGRTVLSLLVGTPALAAFGAVGAAITVSIRRGGLIAPVLIAPLCVPVLIFGVGAIATGPGPDQSGPALLFLAALSLMALALAPFAAAFAITSGED